MEAWAKIRGFWMKVLIFGGFDVESSRLFVAKDYYEAFLSLGAMPYIFPLSRLSTKYLYELVEGFEHILFCGGEDVHPRFYKEEPLIGIRKINILRDIVELEAIKLCYLLNKRVLAICRGIQVMNVAFGGTLFQDINVDGFLSHYQDLDKSEGYHKVYICESLFKKIFKEDEIYVNSFHHQAIERLADGFLVQARSSDDVIEAISREDREFFVGVQWHPELMWRDNESQLELFKSFLGEK